MPEPGMIERVYSEEEIERGLRMLAALNSSTTAEARTGIPSSTLRYWRRHKHAARYDRIRQEMMPRIQKEMAEQAEAAALEQGEVAMEILNQLRTRIADMKPADAASALRNVETAKGINVDKALILRGQPTQITEHRAAPELLDAIARRFPSGVVDGEAEEIGEAEEATDQPAEGPGSTAM